MSSSRSSVDVGEMPALDTTISGNPSEDLPQANGVPKDPVPPSRNTERSAVVIALFGAAVGPCVGDFSTTYNRVNGRLYAATRAILFYSNLFGFERRLCLQFSDIESIEAYRSTSIKISMVDCEDHVFRKFLNRDQVLAVLKELYEKEVDTMPNVSSYPSLSLSESLHGGIGIGHGTSDTSIILRTPNAPRHYVSKIDAGQQQDGEGELYEEAMRQRLSSEMSSSPTRGQQMENVEGARPRSYSVPSSNDIPQSSNRGRSQTAQSLRVGRFRRNPTGLSSKATDAPKLSHSISLSSLPVTSEENGVEAYYQSLQSTFESSSPPAPPGFDMETAWKKKKKPYSEIALKVSFMQAEKIFCSCD